MIFDDERKCLELGHRMLGHYTVTLGTDCSLRLLQRSENVTYLVEHQVSRGAGVREEGAGGVAEPRAVLRLCRPGYHTPEELRAEMLWMEELGAELTGADVSGIRLRQPVRTDEGVYLCEALQGPGLVYYGAVFTYLPGVPLEELPCEEQILWFEKLGEVTALLHRQTKERGCRGQASAQDRRQGAGQSSGMARVDLLPRFRWDYESMIGRRALWGDWRRALPEGGVDIEGDGTAAMGEAKAGIHNRGQSLLEQADSMIRYKLQDYGMTEENYGLIHGDLRGANLLVSGDTLGIIDFDDCGYGWYMQDLAASLSFMETGEAVPELIRAWCRGYRKREVLRQEDLSMIDTFIMMRRLQLLAWIGTRGQAASARRYREDFFVETVRLADKYTGTRG